jgi:hypothetical protein
MFEVPFIDPLMFITEKHGMPLGLLHMNQTNGVVVTLVCRALPR